MHGSNEIYTRNYRIVWDSRFRLIIVYVQWLVMAFFQLLFQSQFFPLHFCCLFHAKSLDYIMWKRTNWINIHRWEAPTGSSFPNPGQDWYWNLMQNKESFVLKQGSRIYLRYSEEGDIAKRKYPSQKENFDIGFIACYC